ARDDALGEAERGSPARRVHRALRLYADARVHEEGARHLRALSLPLRAAGLPAGRARRARHPRRRDCLLMPWGADRHLRFARGRFAPFGDLVALVRVRPGLRVIDLGCGTGELTRRLADALPESEVLGIDSSTEMLAKAQAHARPGVVFVQRSIE